MSQSNGADARRAPAADDAQTPAAAATAAGVTGTRPAPLSMGNRAWQPPAWLWPACLVSGLVVVLTAILALQFIPGQVQVNEGEVARQNVRAPQKTTYISQIKTREARDKAVLGVADVYEYDAGLAQQQKAKAAAACQTISAIRYDFQSTTDQKRDRLSQISDIRLTERAVSETLSISDSLLQAVCSESVRVVEEVMRERLRPAGAADAKAKLAARFSPTLPAGQVALATEIAAAFVQANELYNADETVRRRRDALAAVEPVRFTVEKGEIVVREGNVITALDLERLEALGLRNPAMDLGEALGRGLLAALLVAILSLYLKAHHPAIWRGERRTLLLAVLIVAAVAIAKLTLPGRVGLVYLFPFAAVPMIVALLLDQQLGLLVALIISLLIGPVADNSLEITMISLIGGSVGVLTLQRVERVSAFIWSGLYVAVANYATILAVHLPMGDYDTAMLVSLAGTSLANGAISAALVAIAALPLGSFFGITTLIQLLELAHPSQPLFRRLLLEAPGTYHHSVVVASLAERAASAIGADSLLARVASYYHDVGKTVRPYFFIENQEEGFNVHDGMDPVASAQAIMAHVPDGANLARRHHLPQEIVDVIQQHHGTRLVSFFYGKAVRQATDGQTILEAPFQYPGPKPQTRVAALVMLADAVEATVRSNPNRSPEEIESAVGKVIDERLMGQLDESGLTLKELETSRLAFVRVLQGVYHPRVTYPTLPQPSLPEVLPKE